MRARWGERLLAEGFGVKEPGKLGSGTMEVDPPMNDAAHEDDLSNGPRSTELSRNTAFLLGYALLRHLFSGFLPGAVVGNVAAARRRGRELNAPRKGFNCFVMTQSLRYAMLVFIGGILMPTPQQKKTKRDTLNIRIKPELRGLIDRAAELSGKNRTDFVLDAARLSAENALLDRTVFAVNAKAYAEFLARLDAPPRPNVRLRRSLRTTAPWEK